MLEFSEVVTFVASTDLARARAFYEGVLGWSVANVEDTVRTLMSRGVQFERFDELEQNEWRIWEAPDGAQVAWFKDPDGNLLSLTQA